MRTEAEHKARVFNLYRNVLAVGDARPLDDLVSPDYMPHCAPLADVPVLEPGLGALRSRIQGRGPTPHRLYRVVADGDLVFAQVRYTEGSAVAGTDIFRFDASGRIVEHWNSRQHIPRDDARGVDRFEGGGDPSLPTPPERRREMKRIMTDVLLEMWGKGNADLVPVFYDESYVQHNPDMPGGYARIREIVETEIPKYIELTGGPYPVDIQRMGAEGDLICIHYSIFMAGIGRNAGAKATNTDIFRIDEHNRMIEHWDVLQMEGEPLPNDRTLF